MHRLFLAIGLIVASAAYSAPPIVESEAPTAAPPLEYGWDRPGMDYRNFSSASAAQCQQTCNREARCKAFTWVRPGIQGPFARCWLKTGVPNRVYRVWATSGRAPIPEYGVDRPGMDFLNFNLAAANPDLCRAACYGNWRCRAWTYVRPGVQGPMARCWLKHSVPIATRSFCCSSGIR